MKLSVRSKVANGLVICLLVPRVASTAVEMFDSADEGLKSFSASDEFILGAENVLPTNLAFQDRPSGDPSNRPGNGPPPHPSDPSGHGPPPHAGPDPSGFDPSACEPSSSRPQPGLVITAPEFGLVTAECDPSGGGVDPSGHWDPSGCSQLGASDFFEISIDPAPEAERVFRFESTDTSEAVLLTDMVVLGDHACFPTAIWVAGQNDGLVDGDQPYDIDIYEVFGVDDEKFVQSIPGINLDDDNYKGISVEVGDPVYNPKTNDYLVRLIAKIAEDQDEVDEVYGNNLIITVTPKLAIADYALRSPIGEIMMKPHELVIKGIDLNANNPIDIDLRIVRRGGGPQVQKVFASFVKPEEGLISSGDTFIPPPSP